ncbi:hypothetical protein MPH47_06200 [Psychrobacillus psychrodurans]|uniref:hypothetical protein n=1 Tax=Psychrobacillus psychrodurans TaxID=126157 RepID=UPI001F4E02B6|nr:hypothetical protein [Psychrobacillus psychrodurans]MCK1996822.1 hypothetical protein [Psychrobacillus psychrodurans]
MTTQAQRKAAMMRQPIRIQRRNDEELNQAIADLEERGFKLKSRGSRSEERKNFDYREKRGNKLHFTDSETHSRCWAIMQRGVAP